MLGHEMGWENPWDATDEIARLTPAYAGLSRERLGRRGLQWPIRADGSDSPTLYDTTFDNASGKGQFAVLPYKSPGDAPDSEFPLVLVTGRVLPALQRGNDNPPHPTTSSSSTVTGWRSIPTTPLACGSPTATWSRSAAASGRPSCTRR